MDTANPQQTEAINTIETPLLILAGAGSGKTAVITRKITTLIANGYYRPGQILAVTFTNKAAREMKERVQQQLADTPSRGLRISTFHTFGLDILKRDITRLGYPSHFTLMDDQDCHSLLNEIASECFQPSRALLRRYKQQIALWKYANCMPEEVQIAHQDSFAQQCLAIYQRYQAHLKAYGAVDFDDLIFLPVRLFHHFPEVLDAWQRRIHYVLVDEYQDTNLSQYQLIKLLVTRHRRFTMVGDDDQSIYAWRGADPANMSILSHDFPELKVLKLEQNYRSSMRILHCANHLIEYNTHLYKKALWCQHAMGNPVRILPAADEQAEAARIIGEIIGDSLQTGYAYENYAVLYRGNHQSFLLEKQCREYRIPYRLSGGSSFFAKKEIKDFLAYLRLITNPDDNKALLRIINLPRREIGPQTVTTLSTYAQRRGCALLPAIDEIGLAQALSNNALQCLQSFKRLIDQTRLALEQAPRSGYKQVFMDLVEHIDYFAYLVDCSGTSEQAQRKYNNVVSVIDWLDSICQQNTEPLPQIINRLICLDMMDQKEEENSGGVHLLTLHAAKGLEFASIFLMGLEEGLLPHQQSIDEGQIEEERRLLYVGITRARENLTLTYARQRKRYGEVQATTPSRFLEELPEQHIHWQGRTPQSAEQKQASARRNIAQLKAMLNMPDE